MVIRPYMRCSGNPVGMNYHSPSMPLMGRGELSFAPVASFEGPEWLNLVEAGEITGRKRGMIISGKCEIEKALNQLDQVSSVFSSKTKKDLGEILGPL